MRKKNHPSHIFDSADLWCFRRSRLWNLQVQSEDRNSSSACAKVSKNTWPNHSTGGCLSTTRLCMCKLHLFRRCRFRRWGFCCRGHGLCGSLDISQHTDSRSKSSATSSCLGRFIWPLYAFVLTLEETNWSLDPSHSATGFPSPPRTHLRWPWHAGSKLFAAG